MSIGYCIAAHSKPAQCRRLVQRLLGDDPECKIILHFDQRQSGPFDLGEAASPRVHMLRPRAVHWGSSQLADLFVEMFREAVARGCSYVVMLSGQDYPLRHLAGLEAELSRFDVWADANPLFAGDGSCNWPEGRRRYSYHWFHADDPPRAIRGAERVAASLLRTPPSTSEPPLPRLVRDRVGRQIWWGVKSRGPGVPIFAGSTWMDLSARAVEVITSSSRAVTSFFHHVPSPDEAWFHTVLHNSTSITFAPTDARYIRWNEGEPHPEVLTIEDLDDIRASGAHFGRKFDMAVDALVLDSLDVLSRSSRSDVNQFIYQGPAS
jgi:Core-2/I-Branching enzyme